MIMFWITFFILGIRLSTKIFILGFIQPILILILTLLLTKVNWYNKKQGIRAGIKIKEVILIISTVLLLVYSVFIA